PHIPSPVNFISSVMSYYIHPINILTAFLFMDTATSKIYTLSLHDALPISPAGAACGSTAPRWTAGRFACCLRPRAAGRQHANLRSEEHTSELQSPCNLVCRLLLEKKNKKPNTPRCNHTQSTYTH